MAKLVFGMMQSLDGNVDNMEFAPGPALFRHFIEEVRGLTGCVYGRRRYEIMRFWDEDHPDWVGGNACIRGCAKDRHRPRGKERHRYTSHDKWA
jgi:hypothetical protein